MTEAERTASSFSWEGRSPPGVDPPPAHFLGLGILRRGLDPQGTVPFQQLLGI